MTHVQRQFRLWPVLALAALAASSCSSSAPTTAVADSQSTETASATDALSPQDSTGADTAVDGATAKPVQWATAYAVTATYPEGGAYDGAGQAFFVGSLGNGSVHRVDATTGKNTEVFVETAKGIWWTLGMDVQAAPHRLWVCAMDDRSPELRAGFIWVFDLTTGKRVANHPLAAAAKDATCTDVVVAKDGSAYVVDRENPNVYRVDLQTGATLFASSPDLKGGLAGQNAVVLLPDESALLTVVYLPPKLVRIDMASKAVQAVQLEGAFSDDALLAGADGMAYVNGDVYVAFSTKLARIKPKSANWTQAVATMALAGKGMTDVIHTPNGLYLLNGQAIRFALGQAPDPFALVRFDGAL